MTPEMKQVFRICRRVVDVLEAENLNLFESLVILNLTRNVIEDDLRPVEPSHPLNPLNPLNPLTPLTPTHTGETLDS